MYTTFSEYFKNTEHPDLETVKRMKIRGCEDWNDGFRKVCQNGDIEIYNYFVDNGVNWWKSGLGGACEGGNMELVELLIEEKEPIFIPFLAACRGGYVDIIKLLYAKNPSWHTDEHSILSPIDYHIQIIYEACYSGKMDAVSLILELGFDNFNGGLWGAAHGGHLEIAKLMIDKGANELDSALRVAIQGGHLEMVKFLLTLGGVEIPPKLLLFACYSGNVELVKFSLGLGEYDVNQGLLGALQGEDLEIVKWMIELGADIDALSPWIVSSLHPSSTKVNRYLAQVYPSSFSRYETTEDLDVYKIYLQRGGKFDQPKYKCLVSCQYPLYTIVIHFYQKQNKLIRMLPVDVWKMMTLFL